MDKEYEGSLNEWDIVIDTNIKALLAMTRMIVPGMVERGCGHIINIGSIAGDAAYAGGSVYCATKAAVKALSDGLRIDLVDTPLRVTNIKPGMVETNFSVVRFRGDKNKADAVYEGLKPLTGDDIADVVYYAASAPAHIQIAEVLVMPTNQATGTVCHRQKTSKHIKIIQKRLSSIIAAEDRRLFLFSYLNLPNPNYTISSPVWITGTRTVL